MDTYRVKPRVALSRVVVLVERHLQLELGLLDQLDTLNQTLKRALDESGAKGVSPKQAGQLSRMADELSGQSLVVKGKRARTLSAINAGNDPNCPTLSILQFIRSLDAASEKRLEALRETILDRLTEIHATLIGNQTVMFYSYDFYRKMVAGLLNRDLDENQYSLSGQNSGVKPGNLYRKVC